MGLFNFIVTKFHEGGPVEMGLIALVLAISVVIIVERTMRLWFHYDMANASGFMATIQKLIMNNSIENAIRACKKERPKLLAYVLAEGLKRANDSIEEIENALEHATLSAIPKITNRVPFLATTANMATLFGLLGTIHGLIRSFAALGTMTGDQKQEALAQGISQALNATFFGLSVALLCLLAYGILSLKQKQLVDDINKHSARLLDLLYTRKVKLKGRSA